MLVEILRSNILLKRVCVRLTRSAASWTWYTTTRQPSIQSRTTPCASQRAPTLAEDQTRNIHSRVGMGVFNCIRLWSWCLGRHWLGTCSQAQAIRRGKKKKKKKKKKKTIPGILKNCFTLILSLLILFSIFSNCIVLMVGHSYNICRIVGIVPTQSLIERKVIWKYTDWWYALDLVNARTKTEKTEKKNNIFLLFRITQVLPKLIIFY